MDTNTREFPVHVAFELSEDSQDYNIQIMNTATNEPVEFTRAEISQSSGGWFEVSFSTEHEEETFRVESEWQVVFTGRRWVARKTGWSIATPWYR